MNTRPRIALLALALAAAPAFADYKAGMDALAVRDYAKARMEFEREPDNGQAVFQLARMAQLGLGEPRNEPRAANLYQRGSNLGHPGAKAEYAFALGNGRGVAKDGTRALQLLEELAAGGTPAALVDLGRALRFGWWGAAKDEARATELFRRAMEGGNDSGSYYYAQALMSGTGVAKNEARGAELLKQASDRGHLASQLEYARRLTFGIGIPKDEAAGLALYRKAAETAAPVAQYSIAMAYFNGRGVPRDEAAAARWADAAARQGHGFAQLHMGDAFANGLGVPRMRNEAYYWYTVAAKAGDAAGERANERRATLARDMTPEVIERQVRRADGFQPVAGFRPRAEPLPVPATGDQFSLGAVKLSIPAPRGYINGWQFAEMMQKTYPNDPDMRPLLMVLNHQEDTERVKLGVPTSLRSIEIARHLPDDALVVSPALFADLKRQLRDRLQQNVSLGKFRIESTVLDDDRGFAFVRSSSADGRIDGVSLLMLKERVISLTFVGFRAEQLRELKELVKSSADDILASNRSGLF